MGLLVVRGLILRWLLLTRRRLAREQAHKRLEALKAKAAEIPEQDIPQETEGVDLAKVDLKTQRLVRSGILFSLLIGLWLIWSDVLPALDVFSDTELWRSTRQVSETIPDAQGRAFVVTREELVPTTVSQLGFAVVLVVMTLVAARNLPSLLEITLLRRLPLVPGERYAVTTLVGYLIVVAGIMCVFHVIGLGWGKLQWLVAAMGVGLGFGLQEIFANFISGLIILFEQPIRVGNTVTVGGINGTVTKIRIRATRILDWDRKELIVPNKEFVTGQLVNWTLSDSVLRVIIPVGIAYGSDTERAVHVLHEVATEHPLVLDDPPHEVLFFAFGLYRSLWEYAGTRQFLKLIGACIFGTLAITLIEIILPARLPLSVLAIQFLAFLLLTGGVRILYRIMRGMLKSKNYIFLQNKSLKVKVMIVGAGDAGSIIIREMFLHTDTNRVPVVAVDDDINKQGKNIHGVKKIKLEGLA